MKQTPVLLTALLLMAMTATAQQPVAKQTTTQQQGGAPPAPIQLEHQDVEYEGGSRIRLLPPRQRENTGATLVETLLLDPEVRQVVFYVDGEVRTRRRRSPWQTKLKLDNPAREQVVRVEALDLLDRVVGSDELIFNKKVKSLRVRIRDIEIGTDEIKLEADISLPEVVELDDVEVFLNQGSVRTFSSSEITDDRIALSFPVSSSGDTDFVRVVANLGDGRAIEDTRLLSETVFQEEIDVQLVQLQVLVTDKQGRPLKGFEKEHFEIRDKGGVREASGLFQADDVSLLLGYAIDSSGSMRSIWEETLVASRMFLDATLTDRDEGFLVDFDWTIRLVEGRTGDKQALDAGLDDIEPEGGTALYDSVLFSLLQFDRQQGRRGLVVLTDGFDSDSTSDPNRAVEFARRLGVPVYVVALELPGANVYGVAGMSGPAQAEGAAALAELKLLTDPTGGRLIRVQTLAQMRQALTQINAEMRNQYVLTYYTDTPPEPGKPPKIVVTVDGMKGLKARAVLGADQIY